MFIMSRVAFILFFIVSFIFGILPNLFLMFMRFFPGHRLYHNLDAPVIQPYTATHDEQMNTATQVFTNIWSGGRLIDSGQINVLYNNHEFASWLWSHVSNIMSANIWSYPPSYMFIACLLGLFPLMISYVMWQVGNVFFSWWCMKKIHLPIWFIWIGFVFNSGAIANIHAGHNGTFFSMLLFMGMAYAVKDKTININNSPYLSGIMFGLLFMKPPFAIMVPFIILGIFLKDIKTVSIKNIFDGMKNVTYGIKILIGCLGTVCILFLMTLICFGWNAWVGFFHVTNPTMSAFLQRPWKGTVDQIDFVSPFISFRSLGCSLTISWILQGLVSCICGYFVTRIWKSNDSGLWKIMASSNMIVLITPYAHDYDMFLCSMSSIYLIYVAILSKEIKNILLVIPVWFLWVLIGFMPLAATLYNEHENGVMHVMCSMYPLILTFLSAYGCFLYIKPLKGMMVEFDKKIVW